MEISAYTKYVTKYLPIIKIRPTLKCPAFIWAALIMGVMPSSAQIGADQVLDSTARTRIVSFVGIIR
jgi:hypothetical protein